VADKPPSANCGNCVSISPSSSTTGSEGLIDYQLRHAQLAQRVAVNKRGGE